MVCDDFVSFLLPKFDDRILIDEPQLSDNKGYTFSMIPVQGRDHVIYGNINWAFELL